MIRCDDGERDAWERVELRLGVIDFLSTWGLYKRAAYALKFAERNKATVPPATYAARFLAHVERTLAAPEGEEA